MSNSFDYNAVGVGVKATEGERDDRKGRGEERE